MRFKTFILVLGLGASEALAAATPRAATSAFRVAPRGTHLDWNTPRSDNAFLSKRDDMHSVEFFNDPAAIARRNSDRTSPRAAQATSDVHWENLGGSVASHPSAVSWSSSRLDIFHKTATGYCQHRSYDTSTWSAWDNLGGSLAGAVATCSRSSGSISVGVRGTDGQCWHRPYSGGSWAAWEPLGGNVVYDPGFVARYQDTMDAFVSAPDGQLWQKTWTSSGWASWQAQGGYLDSSPRVASWGSSHMSVTCRGNDGQTWWKQWNGFTWGSWTSLGGSVVGTPSTVVWVGFEFVFVLGTDGACWHRRWQSSSGWGSWISLGGSLKHEPEAITYHYSSSSSVQVYINHQDGGVYRKSWDNRTDTWSQEWEPMGGQIDSKPGVISWGDSSKNRADAFGQGTDASCQRLVLSDGTNDGSFGK